MNTVSSQRSGFTKISCDMKGNYFPFDVQHCYWSYLSFPLHSADVLLLNANIDHKNSINYAQEFEFEIQSYPSQFFFNENNSNEISQSLSLATPKWISLAKNYSVIGFEITFKRSFSKYFWMYYLPSILVVLMCAGSFIIPPNVIPGRMALLVTLFLVQIDSVQKITVSLKSTQYKKLAPNACGSHIKI